MPTLTPNRALARARLEQLAWQVTPSDYRGGSGSRRTVLVSSADGTSSQPLSELTDNQLRKYIGPRALEEAGDMKINGRGIYHGTAAQEDDYVIHRHSGNGLYRVDRVGSAGRHATIGKPASSLKGAVDEVRKEARRRGYTSGIIFEQRGDDLAQIGQVKRGTGMDFESNHRDGAPREPRFRIGDRVEDLEGDRQGKVGYIGGWQGEEYGGYAMKLDRDDGSQRLTVPENKFRLIRNAGRAREAADETAARELSLFIENDYALVGAPNSQGKSIETNLLRKVKSGRFNLALSEKLWMYLMESGAKKYAREHGDGEGSWSRMFNKPTRELVAHEFATTFAEEHQLKSNASVEDGDYVVQGSYSDGTVCEEFGFDDEDEAIREAKKLKRDPAFEGDNVRVITRDGELVYES